MSTQRRSLTLSQLATYFEDHLYIANGVLFFPMANI